MPQVEGKVRHRPGTLNRVYRILKRARPRLADLKCPQPAHSLLLPPPSFSTALSGASRLFSVFCESGLNQVERSDGGVAEEPRAGAGVGGRSVFSFVVEKAGNGERRE